MNSNFFKKHKSLICCILAFFLPVILMFIISKAMGFYPFGRRSALVADMRYQFIDYAAYLKSVVFSDNDLLYTFSKTMGGDMAGFSFYYLADPFLLLLLFVPNKYLPAGILMLIILIMGLSSLNFEIMLNRIFGIRWASVIFATAYAFIGYFTAYFNFTIYFNNIMLLPLIILGLYMLITKERKNYLYIISLFFSVLTSYYMGYMTCMFTMIFTLYLFIMRGYFRDIKAHLKTLLIYIGSSALAVMMSFASLLISLLSLRDQKIGDAPLLSRLSLSLNFNMRDVFSGLYVTSFRGNISDGLPIIYCSSMTVIFVMLYFMNTEIALREKMASLSAIVIMLLSFYIDGLNVAWHGFSHPVGFPYRNSFFLSFLLIYTAYKGLISMKTGNTKKHIIISAGIFIIYSLYMLLSDNEYVSRDQVVLTGAIMGMILFGVYGIRYKKEYMAPIIVGLFIVESIEALISGYSSISKYFTYDEESIKNDSIDKFIDYHDKTLEMLNDIEDNDDSFYRIEKLFRRTHNDAMFFSYNGLSHFSSCEDSSVKSYMKKLGFPTTSLWSFYGDGSTSFVDCLMGVRYLLSPYDETPKPYRELAIYDGERRIFYNPYALGLAIGADIAINGLDYGDYRHFDWQNAIASAITGEKEEIYRPVTVSGISLHNVEDADGHYRIIDENEEAYVEYMLDVDSTDFIFMYFDAPGYQDTRLYVNELEKQPYFDTYQWSIRETGHFNAGEKIPVRIYLDQDEIEIDGYEFYYEDKEKLAEFYEKASQTGCSVDKIKSSHLIITADVAEGSGELVFTIPYNKGWRIYVDGEKKDYHKVLDALIAIDTEPGKHIIEMKYVPLGTVPGVLISALAFLVFIGMIINDTIIMYKNRHNRKVQIIE